MQHFRGTDYRTHTSCISEAQKYQGALYKEKDKGKSKGEKRKSLASDAMVPRQAYVEDAPEGDDANAVAIIDVPPRAPTPPPASEAVGELADTVNVFDFLVTDDATKSADRTPNEQRMTEHPAHYGNGDYAHFSQYPSNGSANGYLHHGFAYGNTPVPSSFARYDSWQELGDSQNSHGRLDPHFVTPAPKDQLRRHKEKHVTISEGSDKKRKRQQVEELDLSSTKRPPSRDLTMTDAPSDPRVLHSGLTGGLSKLVTDSSFYEDRIDAGPTPILSPLKRTRRDNDAMKVDRRKSSYADYDTVIIKPSNSKPSTTRHDAHREAQGKKYHDDTHTRSRRPRSLERISYHDDKHHTSRRQRSAERERADKIYHESRRRPTTIYRESVSSSDRDRDRDHRKPQRAIEYHPSTTAGATDRPSSVQPNSANQIITYSTQADLFLSFINKGPDSERGCSINKVLKRYHRERDVRGDAKDEDDKELWKALRLRKNDRGEIVVFL